MQTLESLKSRGQAGFWKLKETLQEQPEDVKVWGVTAGSALVGAVAVNATARGVIAILATLASPPVALTVGAVGGGYLGWTYLRNWQVGEQDAAATMPEPAATEIPVTLAESGTAAAFAAETTLATAPVVDESVVVVPPAMNNEPSVVVPTADAGTATMPDNLEAINGIGPVYANRLQNAGIQSFAQLAECSPEQIREIIGTMRSGHMIEPEKWIAEAGQLAAT
ncbi:MAG: helix-hairpin-helix domain-containing protein [Caldilineaceae bacterium]